MNKRAKTSVLKTSRALFAALVALAATCFLPHPLHAHSRPQSQSKAQSKAASKLPRPQRLDQDLHWQRDARTGDLRMIPVAANPNAAAASPNAINVITRLVPVTCTVSTADGTAVPGLRREDFRVLEDGVEQNIVYFDASSQPASVALVIDASPSVLPDSSEMKKAAAALIDTLAPLDQASVIDFAAHVYLQLPFSDVREQIRRAVQRVDVRALLADTGGSNIYEAVYLAARQFSGRTGRKAIVLLTDGQDSGLGLNLNSAIASTTASGAAGVPSAASALTFEDVVRLLAAEDIQVFAVSTESRPKIMTDDWLAAHAGSTLLTPQARQDQIPPDTLFLAEFVRRVGGHLYFLREAQTMADAFRLAARAIRAEYTVGFYPSLTPSEAPSAAPLVAPSAASASAALPGWHQLQVQIAGQPAAIVVHRAAFYVPSGG